jgi:DNA repair protein RecN (Recombination protein N)
VHQQVSEVVSQLEKFSNVGEEYKNYVEQLIESRELLKETSFALQNMLDAVDSDPERLSFIEERLGIYHNLKLKYKLRSGAELVELYEKLCEQADEFASLEGRITELRKLEVEQKENVMALGLELEESREKGRHALEEQINNLLTEVGFNEARLMMKIERNFQENGDLEIEGKHIRATSSGINKVTFLIRTNPGLPMGPLSQIASGGEISRVMLAIKSALADRLEFPVLIFDEIDTGISGEIANKVGRVMQHLAERFQIISITHLPQIASKGHDHFMILKEVENGRTISSVRKLGLDERIYQLARMISGDDPSESAIKNALEMIG